MKVAVLHGEVAKNASLDEKDVIIQVDAVTNALNNLGHKSTVISVSMDFSKVIKLLLKIRPNAVFNLVESIQGQGNLIYVAPAILDSLKLPYTGAKTDAVFLTSNKKLAKEILVFAGIPTPASYFYGEQKKGFPGVGKYIIKSIWEHASVWLDERAVIFAEDAEYLTTCIYVREKELGFPCFAELFIEGREINISLLGGGSVPEVLPPAEIHFIDYPPDKLKVVDYRSKWAEDSFEYRNTQRSFDFTKEDEPLLQRLSELALRCWDIFGLCGYARVDFRVDENNHPWVLEVNTNPCLSPDGGFTAAAKQAGIDFKTVIKRILDETIYNL